MQYDADPDWEEDEEEMSQAERELADDAQWKLIQKNTFTRWANEHLKTVNKNLANLETDFADGLRLIALVEVLSGKKFKHVNKRPNFRTQKLENVTMVLKFLEEDEGIRIVNIGKLSYTKLSLFVYFMSSYSGLAPLFGPCISI
ncbi:filamin-like protein-1 [Elysia marginata]|uniref:Filamin-like protein-1 n=1 Tax=Elysia marginata TaxID=1093978 RepID=A0AAV4FKY4_9GAST|nr:filamin-like protein-1 [Elysia marginata]